jgi:acylphosphatase
VPDQQFGDGSRLLQNRGFKAVAELNSEQREIHYAGRVQGVGFRYTVRSVAARFAVTGFVRNLPDRRVQLVVEGDADEIAKLLDAVKAEMSRYIQDVQETTRPAAGRFQTFEIRH